jgi:hypothetical protein
MNGCRRPHFERVLSESWPITGSMKASRMKANMIARPTVAAGRPTTWV